MAETRIHIESLPKHILEHIFVFVKDRLMLRSVSKYFKDIVDHTPGLMQKYSLNVSKTDVNEPCDMSPYIEELKFNHFSLKEFTFVQNYQHKDKIKSIFIKRDKFKEIKGLLLTIQHILFNFVNMEELLLVYGFPYKNYNYEIEDDEILLFDSPRTKLRSLSISCAYSAILLRAFSNIKTIKKLTLDMNSITEFPDVAWQLEEIRLLLCDELDMETLLIFLDKQKPTLRVLKFVQDVDICNFVTKNFQNLESVALTVSPDTNIEDYLITNNRTKELALFQYKESGDALEILLKHYKYIEKLHIFKWDSSLNEFKNLELPMLKYLFLDEMPINLIINGNLPKLKFLDISLNENAPSLNEVPEKNLMNVEKLTLEHLKDISEFFPMLRKCRSLRELNINYYYKNGSINYIMINKLLEVVPQLKYLGIVEEDLTKQQTTCEEILSKVNSDKLILKVYSNEQAMIHGYWTFEDMHLDRSEEMMNTVFEWMVDYSS